MAFLSIFATAAWERGGSTLDSPHAAVAGPEPGDNALADVWPTPINVPGFRSASISANGAFVATVSAQQHIICVRHQNGRIVWSRPAPGVENADVSSDGKVLIAYAPLDPTRTGITIYQGAHGEAVNQFALDGAIWDVGISSDSLTATIATGAHTLYSFRLDGRPAGRKWSLDGIGDSLSISRDSKYIAAGTWDDSGVCIYDTTEIPDKQPPAAQAPVWRYPAAGASRKSVSNRLFEVQIAYNAPYVLGISYANFRHTNPTVYLWRLNGRLQWSAPMELGPDASSPKAFITGNGQYVALSYISTVSHGDQVLQQRHLIVLDRNGQQVFYLPGFLFSPTLIAASPDGSNVLISDGSNKLYTVSIDGRMSSPRAMPSPIQQTIASEDGHFILVYTADGNLNLMRLG